MKLTKYLSLASAALLVGTLACGSDGTNPNNGGNPGGGGGGGGGGDTTADFKDGGKVDIFGKSFPVKVIDKRITKDTTLDSGTVWLLNGTVSVGTGDAKLNGGAPSSQVTLTIQPGTQVYAKEGSATALVITRGSKIKAEGTAELPIVFAAVEADLSATNVITGDPTDMTSRGKWGGLVLSGLAQENSGDAHGELLTEAAPADQERYFGGKDDQDSSGSLKYVIIAESGFEFRTDQEVQGLTVEAAGSGTTIEYVQVIGSEDDCIEWFGGMSKNSHLVCLGPDDDGLDMDEGFRGSIQYAIVSLGAKNGDRGIESDNNGGGFEKTPVSAPKLANITILGDQGKKGKTMAAMHREGFAGQIWQSCYTDKSATAKFSRGGLFVDDVFPEGLIYRDTVINTSPVIVEGSDKKPNFAKESDTQGDNAKLAVNGHLTFKSLNADTWACEVDGTPTNTPAAPLEKTSYVGAVDPTASTPWWSGWTYIHKDIDGGFPGANYHPLEAKIKDGSLAPAGS